MYKCEKCGFECASQKLMDMHKEREKQGLTEYAERLKIQKDIKEKYNEYLKSK